MFERRIYFTTELSLVVQDNFISIEKRKKVVLVTLNCDEICTFVEALAKSFHKASFCIPLGDPLSGCSFNRDKLVHSKGCEETISALELIWFVKFLVKCIAHTVASDDLTSFVGVSSLHSFASYLASKTTLEKASSCLQSLKFGQCDAVFASFVALHKEEGEKAELCKFLFFHHKLVKSIFLLKSLLKKPS